MMEMRQVGQGQPVVSLTLSATSGVPLSAGTRLRFETRPSQCSVYRNTWLEKQC